MDIELGTRSRDLARTSLFVLGAFLDGRLTASAEILEPRVAERLRALVRAGEIRAEPGVELLVFGLSRQAEGKVLLVGLGAGEAVSEATYRAALASVARALAASTAGDAVVSLTEVEVAGRTAEWRIDLAARMIADGAYRPAAPAAERHAREHRTRGVERVTLVLPGPVEAGHAAAARRGVAIAEGMALARDLGNMPARLARPAFHAETARSLGAKFGFHVEVFERADLEKLAMGAMLAASAGAGAGVTLVVAHYRGGAPAAKAVVLVGEGAAQEPLAAAGEAAASGAGAVLGALWVAARLRLPINLIVLLPTVEAGAHEARPGDVVRSMSGQTIEIGRPAALGRLVLCDALSYAEHFDPACVVDVAAVSAACAFALGGHASCLFANDADLARDLLDSGAEAGDRAWQMPLWDDPPGALASGVADMRHLGEAFGDAVTAACFLSRFAGAYRWAHLDIAGTAAVPGEARGATGRPVPLLASFLIRRAGRVRWPEPPGGAGARP